MVNSSSFDAANNNAAGGEGNGAGAKAVARSGQGHEAPQSGSPVTAATATSSSADNSIETNADGDVTMSIHANSNPNDTSGSLPLEKLHGLLPSDNNTPQTKSKPKLLCLFCDRSFGNANLRQKHVERIHSAKQNRRISGRRQNMSSTPCIHCDKMSNAEHTLNELFKHMVHEHPTKYFGCLPCEDRFITQLNLSDHNSINHPSTDLPLPPIELVIPEHSIPPQKVTRSRLKPKQEDPLNLPDEDEFKKPADVKKKRTNVKDKEKTSRVVVKRSKRLQAQLKEVEGDKRRTRRGQKLVEPEQTSNSTKSPDKSKHSVSINPYPEFDTYYRIKKITDHSIDNLKISSLTFDDVFDKAFFNRIKCNIEDNLLHHIDGKLFKNEESETRISNFEKFGSQSVQNLENYGCELSLNAITPVAALCLNSQYGEDFESQIEYGSKPSKKKTTPVKKDEIHYKYFTRRKYQASILEQKENRDLSRLDMWTQLVIKERQQKIINDQKSTKEILEYTSGEEYKSKIKREELDRILDRRGPFEDLKEEISKKAAFDKLNSTSENAVSAEVFTVVREVVNDILARVLDGSEDEPTPATADNKPDDRLIPAFLNLRPTSSLPEEEIDKSDRIALICSSQETENFELPTNKARRKDETIELTGEWARSRIYICAACGDKFPNLKYLLEHKSLYHPNVWAQHYEFVGNQSELYRHLAIPGLGKMGVVEEVPQCKQWRRSEARLCVKCRKQCNSLGELHRHLLECGGDWTWILARKKCKYRPFGAKSRRKRRLLTRIQRKEKTDSTDTEKKIYKKTYYNGPRSKPSDAETIQRMLANLPAKRSRRSFVSLRDVIFKSRKRNTTPQSQENSSDNNTSSNKSKNNKNQRLVNMPSNRRTLRSINKVLSSTILDSSLLRVKRKMKINEQRTTRRGRKRSEDHKEHVTESVEENTKRKKSLKDKDPLIVSNTNMQNKIARKRILNSRLNIKNFFPVKKRNSRRTDDNEVIVNPISIRPSRNIPSIEKIKEDRQGGGLKGLVRNLRKKNSSPSEDKVTTSPSRRPKLTRQQSKESVSSEKSTGKSVKKEEKKKEKTEEKAALETTPVSVKEKVANKIKEKRCLKKIKPLEEKPVDTKPKNKNLKKKFQTIINNVKNLTLDTTTDVQTADHGISNETPVNPHTIFLEKGVLEKTECSLMTKEPLLSLEAKEEGVMKESSVHVVTNLMDSKENPPIPEKMFNLEPGNEQQLQAKGELNFDKKVDFPPPPCSKKPTSTASATTLLSINVDMPEKPKHLISPTLISPSLKGKIRKPAKGLNDCIAMLTSKLQQKLSPSLPAETVPSVSKVPEKVEEKLTNPVPSPKLPILRIPTFKVTTPTDEPNEIALDLSTKSTEKLNVTNKPDNTSVYFEPPKELQLSEFGSTLNKVIGDVIEHKCKEVLSEKLTSHGWTSVNDIIQKVINSESKNLTRNSPAPVFPKNNVDDSIETVIRRYSLETTDVSDLINKSKKTRNKTSNRRRANSEKNLSKSSEITLISLLQDGDVMSRSLQNIPFILSPPVFKRDEVVQKEMPVSLSVETVQKVAEIEPPKPISPPKNESIQKVIEITSTPTSRGDPVQKVLEISTMPVSDDYDELDIERLIPETKLQKIIPGQEPSIIKTDQNYSNLPISNVISFKNTQEAQPKTDWIGNSKASVTLENESINVNKIQVDATVSGKSNESCIQPVFADIDKELLSQIDAVLSKANNLVDIDSKKPKPKRNRSRRKTTNDTTELDNSAKDLTETDLPPAESNIKKGRGRRKKEPQLESKANSEVLQTVNSSGDVDTSSKNLSERVTGLEVSPDLSPADSNMKKGRGRKKKESIKPKANTSVFETQNMDLDASSKNPGEIITDLQKPGDFSPTTSNVKRGRGRKKKESKPTSTNSEVLDTQNNTLNDTGTSLKEPNLDELADLPSVAGNFKPGLSCERKESRLESKTSFKDLSSQNNTMDIDNSLKDPAEMFTDLKNATDFSATDGIFKPGFGRKKKELQLESKTNCEDLESLEDTMDLETRLKDHTKTFTNLEKSTDLPLVDSNLRTSRGRRKKESQLKTEINSENYEVMTDTSLNNVSETFETSTNLPTTDSIFKKGRICREQESKPNYEVLEIEKETNTTTVTAIVDNLEKSAELPLIPSNLKRSRGRKKKETQPETKANFKVLETEKETDTNSKSITETFNDDEIPTDHILSTESVDNMEKSADLPLIHSNLRRSRGRKKTVTQPPTKENFEVLETEKETDTNSKSITETFNDDEIPTDHILPTVSIDNIEESADLPLIPSNLKRSRGRKKKETQPETKANFEVLETEKETNTNSKSIAEIFNDDEIPTDHILPTESVDNMEKSADLPLIHSNLRRSRGRKKTVTQPPTKENFEVQETEKETDTNSKSITETFNDDEIPTDHILPTVSIDNMEESADLPLIPSNLKRSRGRKKKETQPETKANFQVLGTEKEADTNSKSIAETFNDDETTTDHILPTARVDMEKSTDLSSIHSNLKRSRGRKKKETQPETKENFEVLETEKETETNSKGISETLNDDKTPTDHIIPTASGDMEKSADLSSIHSNLKRSRGRKKKETQPVTKENFEVLETEKETDTNSKSISETLNDDKTSTDHIFPTASVDDMEKSADLQSIYSNLKRSRGRKKKEKQLETKANLEVFEKSQNSTVELDTSLKDLTEIVTDSEKADNLPTTDSNIKEDSGRRKKEVNIELKLNSEVLPTQKDTLESDTSSKDPANTLTDLEKSAKENDCKKGRRTKESKIKIKTNSENLQTQDNTVALETSSKILEDTSTDLEPMDSNLNESSLLASDSDDEIPLVKLTKNADNIIQNLKQTTEDKKNPEVLEHTEQADNKIEHLKQTSEEKESPQVIEKTKQADKKIEKLKQTSEEKESPEVFENTKQADNNVENLKQTGKDKENPEVLEDTGTSNEKTQASPIIVNKPTANAKNKARKRNTFVAKTFMKKSRKKKSNEVKNKLVQKAVVESIASESTDKALNIELDQSDISGENDQGVSPNTKGKSAAEPLDASTPISTSKSHTRRKSKTIKKIDKVDAELFKDFALVINKKTKRIPPTNIVDDSVCDEEDTLITSVETIKTKSAGSDDAQEDMELEEIPVSSAIIERNSIVEMSSDLIGQNLGVAEGNVQPSEVLPTIDISGNETTSAEVISADDAVASKTTSKKGKRRKVKPGKKAKNNSLSYEISKAVPVNNVEESKSLELENIHPEHLVSTENKEEIKHVEELIRSEIKQDLQLPPVQPKRRGRKPRSTQNSLSETLDQTDIRMSFTADTSKPEEMATNEPVKDVLTLDLSQEVKNKEIENHKIASQFVMPVEQNVPNGIIESKSRRRKKSKSNKEISTSDATTIENIIFSEDLLTTGTKKRKSRNLKKDLEGISSQTEEFTQDICTEPFESTKEPSKEASADEINEILDVNIASNLNSQENIDDSIGPLSKQFRGRKGKKLKKDIVNVEEENSTKQDASKEIADHSVGMADTTEENESVARPEENLLDVSLSTKQPKNRRGRNVKKSTGIIKESINEISTELLVSAPSDDVRNTHSEFDFHSEEDEPLVLNKRKGRRTKKDLQSSSEITNASVESSGFENISDDLIGSLKTRRGGKNFNLNKEKQPSSIIEFPSPVTDQSVQENIVTSTNLNILPQKSENLKTSMGSSVKISSPERKGRCRKPTAVKKILIDQMDEDNLEGDVKIMENSNIPDMENSNYQDQYNLTGLETNDKRRRSKPKYDFAFDDDMVPETQFDEPNNRKVNKRKNKKSKIDLQESLALNEFQKPLELHDDFISSPLETEMESSNKTKKSEGVPDSTLDNHACSETSFTKIVDMVKRKGKKAKAAKQEENLMLHKAEKSLEIYDSLLNSDLVTESSDKTADPALDGEEMPDSQLDKQCSLNFKIPVTKVKRKVRKTKLEQKENLLLEESENLLGTHHALVNRLETDSTIDAVTDTQVDEQGNLDSKITVAKVKKKGRKAKPEEDMLLVESEKTLEILDTSVKNLFKSVPYVELSNDLSLSLREHQVDIEIIKDFEKTPRKNNLLESTVLTSPKTKRRGRPVKCIDQEEEHVSPIFTEETETFLEDTTRCNAKKSKTGPTICDIILDKIQQGNLTEELNSPNSDQLMDDISNDFTPKEPVQQKENLTDSGLSSSENVSPVPRRRGNKANVSLENSNINVTQESQQQDTPKSKRKSRKSELDVLKAFYHLESNTSSSTPLQESGLGEDSSILPEEKDTNLEPEFVIPESKKSNKKVKELNSFMQEDRDIYPNGVLANLTKEKTLAAMDHSSIEEESKITKENNSPTATQEKRRKSPAKANKKIDVVPAVAELDNTETSAIQTELIIENQVSKEENILITPQEKRQKSPVKTNKKNEKLNSLNEYEPVFYKNIFEEVVEKPSRTRSKSKAILAEQSITTKSVDESIKNQSIYDFVEDLPQVFEEKKILVENVIVELPTDAPVEVPEKPIKTKNKIELTLEPPIYKNIFEIEEKPTRTRNKSKGILEDKPVLDLIKEGQTIEEGDVIDKCFNKNRQKSKGSIESDEVIEALSKFERNSLVKSIEIESEKQTIEEGDVIDKRLKRRKKSRGPIESNDVIDDLSKSESGTLVTSTEIVSEKVLEDSLNITKTDVNKKGRKKSKTNLSDALDVAPITLTADQQKSEDLDVFEFQADEIAPVSILKRSRKKSFKAEIADGLSSQAMESPRNQSPNPTDALEIPNELNKVFGKRPTRGRKKSPQKKTNKNKNTESTPETDINTSSFKEPLLMSTDLLITRTEISDSDLDKQADEEVASLTCRNWDSLVPTDLDESRQSSLSDKAPSLIGARSPSLSPPPEKQEAPKVIDIVPVLNESSDIFDQIKKKPVGAAGSFDIFDSLKTSSREKPTENPEPIVELPVEPKVPKLSMRELKKSKGLLVDEPPPVVNSFIPHEASINNQTPQENDAEQEKNDIEHDGILNGQTKCNPQEIFEEKSIVKNKSKQNKKHNKKNKVAKVRENVLKLFNSNSNLDFDTLKSTLEKITKPVMKSKYKSDEFVAEIEPLTEILTSSYMDIAPVIDEIDKSLEMDDVYDFEDEPDMPMMKQKKGTQYEKKLEPTRRTSNRTAKAKALEHIHDEALSELLDEGLSSVKLDTKKFENDLNKKITKKPKSKKDAESNQVEELNKLESHEEINAINVEPDADLIKNAMPEKKSKKRRSKSLGLKDKELEEIEKIEKIQSPILENQESLTSQKIDDNVFLAECNPTKVLELEKDSSLINATLSHESNSEETLWNKMFAAAKTLKSPDNTALDSLENLPEIGEEIQETSFNFNSDVEKMPDALKVSSENLQNKEIELPVVEKPVKKKPGRKSKKEKELLEKSFTKEFELIENNPELVESLKENQIAIAEKQINSLNEEKIDNGEIRRSRRGTHKIISYNENDLIDPVIEAYEKKRQSLHLKRDKSIDKNVMEVFENLTTIESTKPNSNAEVDPSDPNKHELVDKIYEFTDSPENDDNFGDSISTLRKNKAKPQENVAEIEESSTPEVKTDKVDKFKTPASSVYCEICKKTFQRIENLIKHKSTLTHISKLSELEAKEAELKNKQKELEEQQQLPKSNEEINISGILEAEKPVSNKEQTSFSNNDTLKLADIISEVLNKPTQDSKTQDYDSESDSELETLKLKAKENYSSTLTKTIAEKQISLLENIIEKTSGNLLGRMFDPEPLNHVESDDELPEVDVSSAYKDNSMVYDHNEILKPPNNTFAKPDQYEEISEDSTSLSNFDDQKSRKILNRDEELFLECCSLLKSGSEVSSFSKRDKRSDIIGTRQLVQPEEEAHEYSDNSRTPTPLGDTFDDDASGSNSIASEWNPQPVDKVGKNFTFKEAWMEEPLLTIAQKEVNVQDQGDTGEIDNGIEDRLDSGRSSPSLEIYEPESDNQSDSQEIPPIENKKIITKGARKVFEGLKISIPTEDLDLDMINNCQNINKNDENIESSAKSKGRKSKPTKNSQVGSNVLFKANKKKSPVLPSSNNDVYDFQSTQDIEVFTKPPDFGIFKSHKYDKDEETDNFDDSNGAEAELASNVSNSSYSLLSTKKFSPPLPLVENITKKKSKAMSKIFKNAAKSRIDEIEAEMRDIPEIPEIDNIELVENYVLSCSQMSDREPSPPSDREEKTTLPSTDKPAKMTEKEMDKLFDQLIGKKIEEKPKSKVKSPTKAKSDANVKKSEVNNKKLDVKNGESKSKKQPKQKGRKRVRSDSETDDEFNLNQKKQSRKKKEEDNVIDLEKELRECIGVASRKSQRSCTSGKQNVLVEYWSSDDEAFEKMLQAQNVKKPTKPKASTKKSVSKEEMLSREIEKTLDSVSNSAIIVEDKTEDKSVEEENVRLKADRKKPGRKKKTVNIEMDASKDDDMEEKSEPNDNSVTASSRRKRVASNPLYHWSSSSEDDEPESMVEITSIRDEEEDDRPVQHGWIVGDSPKKLVTMLALIKGKKADTGDSVKEQNKKRTGSTGSAAVS